MLAAAFEELGAKRLPSHFAYREGFRPKEDGDVGRLALTVETIEAKGEPDGSAYGPAQIAGLVPLMKHW